MSESDSKELQSLDQSALDFASSVTGAPGKELGAWFADHVRLWRFKSQISILKKAERACSDAGFTSQRVRTNILVPLLEQASLEEDDAMQNRWAALLANASTSENADAVQPGFVSVLGQLTPLDADVLVVVRMNCQITPVATGLNFRQICSAPSLSSRAREDIDLSLQNLERLGLISYLIVQRGIGAFPGGFPMGLDEKPGADGHTKSVRTVFFTTFGAAFIDACSPPRTFGDGKAPEGPGT